MERFEQAIGQLTIALARVKSIDSSGLNEERKRQRTAVLRQLRVAIETLVDKQYERLEAEAQLSADQLKAMSEQLKTELAQLNAASKILDAVEGAVGVITKLVKLI